MTCSFTFEDVRYEVSGEAYDKDGNIRLPDGRVLQVDGWSESLPPQPRIIGLAINTQVDARPIFEATAA